MDTFIKFSFFQKESLITKFKPLQKYNFRTEKVEAFDKKSENETK